jgi:hypothetical protein
VHGGSGIPGHAGLLVICLTTSWVKPALAQAEDHLPPAGRRVRSPRLWRAGRCGGAGIVRQHGTICGVAGPCVRVSLRGRPQTRKVARRAHAGLCVAASPRRAANSRSTPCGRRVANREAKEVTSASNHALTSASGSQSGLSARNEQVGIVSINDAPRLAGNPTSTWSRWRPRPGRRSASSWTTASSVESALKARESRKNQAQTVSQEIAPPKIDPHDYGTKKAHVERFLRQGDKVR